MGGAASAATMAASRHTRRGPRSRRAPSKGSRPADSSLPRYVNGDLARITAQIVYEAAHDGDGYALEVVHDTAKFLGAGVANVVNILDRKSTRLNSSHSQISYAVFCLKKKTQPTPHAR